MKKRVFGILLSLALVVGMVPVLSQTAYAIPGTEDYGLWVGGVQVTDTNKGNVLSDGTVSFTPEKDGEPATLTLKGAEIYGIKDAGIEKGSANIFYFNNNELKIILVGDNKVGEESESTTVSSAISASNGNVTIEGDGSLTANSFGSTIYGYKGVTINGGQITATASAHNAISAAATDSYISINGGTIIACGGSSDLSKGISAKTVEINGGTVTASCGKNGGKGIEADYVLIDKGMSVMAGDDESSAKPKDTSTWAHDEKWVQVAEAYPLWIKGTHVTSANMKDVLGDGKVSYDPDANILKLKGANITADSEKQYSGAAIYYEGKEKDLTINAAKASTVTATGDDTRGIYTVYKNLIFNGTLNVTGGDDGIDCNGDDITVNGKLTASGSEIGVYLDSGEITVNSGAELSATGSNNSGIGVNDMTGSLNIKEGAKVTAVGGKYGAISGVVKNAIAGTAWTDKGGTMGETAIEVNANRDLGDTYKKVQFPGKTDPAPAPAPAPASDPTAVGSVHAAGGGLYIVTSEGTVSLVKAPSKKTYTLPAVVQLYGKPFIVTGIAAKAFKGTKVRTLTVKTMGLSKATVKGSLKGSKIKTVKVKVGKKKVNKKYVKKYKKIFTKKNAGKKVTVKS